MINCPNCAAPINPRASHCEYCGSWIAGADLAQGHDIIVSGTFYADGEAVLYLSETARIERALSDPDYTQKGGL